MASTHHHLLDWLVQLADAESIVNLVVATLAIFAIVAITLGV